MTEPTGEGIMTTDKVPPITTTIRVDRLTRKRLRHLAAARDSSLMETLADIVALAFQAAGMEGTQHEG